MELIDRIEVREDQCLEIFFIAFPNQIVCKQIRKIVPSHGGGDPGAVSQKDEKDDTLKLTLSVGEILEKNGINVVYTRIGCGLPDTL